MKADKNSFWGVVVAMVCGAVGTALFNPLVFEGTAIAQTALTPTAEVEAQIDRLVASDPMMGAYAEYFPTEWATMRTELAADIKSDISVGELNARAYARSRSFMLERASATASAPTSALTSLMATEADLASHLQRENVQYCADFGFRGLQPNIRLSPAAVQLVSVSVRARILATRQGLNSPARRGSVTDDDGAALFERMLANGTSEATLDAFDNPAAAKPETLCEGTVQLYRALTELPPEQAARIYSMITLEANTTATAPAP